MRSTDRHYDCQSTLGDAEQVCLEQRETRLRNIQVREHSETTYDQVGSDDQHDDTPYERIEEGF